MKTVVLGFAGRIASGKTTISKASANALGLPWVSFGDYVRHITKYIGLDTNDRVVLQDVGNFLIKYPQAFCAKVLEQAPYRPGAGLVIDGIRHKEVVDELRYLVTPTPFILIYISAENSTVVHRLREAGKNEYDVNFVEQDPTEFQVRNTLANLADIRINNDFRPLEDVIDELFQSLKTYTE